MTIGSVASSIVPEYPPLKLNFSEVYYANENFTADTGQFTQFSIGGAGSFSVVSGQGVITNSTGSQKDRFCKTGSAINNPVGFFQIDVVSVSGVPNNFNIIAVGIAKDASNGIWAEHDALNNQTRIDVRIGGVANLVLISQTLTAPYTLALSVYKNHLIVLTDTGSGFTQQILYDIPSSIIDLTTTDLSVWFPCFGASSSNNATCTWTVDNFKANKARYNCFELQPPALIFVNELFNADTGQFTTFTETGTTGTFTVSGGQGTIAQPSGGNIILVEGADITLPQLFISIDVVSHPIQSTGFDNIGVGIAKDANNFIWAGIDRTISDIRIQTKIGGSNSFHAGTTQALTPPYTLALGLVGNQASVWYNQGSQWIKATTYDVSPQINLKTATLTGWKGGWTQATPSSSTWVFDNFKVGRFGTVGVRDQCIVTGEDGYPYISNNDGYFTATCLDPNGVGYMGVFSFDLNTRLIAQTGVIMTSRSSAVQNDLSGHIIKYNNNADCRLFISSWANGFGNTLQVLHGTATGTDLCVGTHIVTVSALTLPGHISSPTTGGEYDPFAVKIGSTWYLAYTITADTTFSGSPFYSAAATSTDLSTWTQIGSPDSSNKPFEGTKISKMNGKYFIYSGGSSTARCYDLLTFTFQGLLNVTTTGGSDTYPHPMIFPNGKNQVFLSFDNLKYNAVNFTWGNLRIYEAPRYKK